MPDNDEHWGKFLGYGLQMLVGVGLGLLIGRWLDDKFGWTPRGALIGAFIGIAGGMYLMIKEAIKVNKD